jgi:hypothetical protein
MKNLLRKIKKETQIIEEMNYRHRRITELQKEENLNTHHALLQVERLIDEAKRLRTKLEDYTNKQTTGENIK